MHENLEIVEEMDVDLDYYILSKDSPEELNLLYEDLENYYGKSVAFISDPELELIDQLGMKNGEVAFRGYALLDEEGKVIFQTKNDHWGEEIEQTMEEVKKEYNNR